MNRLIYKARKTLAERFPKIAMAYIHFRDSMPIIRELKETPMGFKFVGNRTMEEGTYEPRETEIVKKILQQVDIFINIGANIGYYCCLSLQRNKHTVAFEPIELNLKYLYKNIRANHWENSIEVFPMALSDKASIIEIYGGGTGASLIKGWAGTPVQYATLVPTSTIDQLLSSRFKDKRCFILVDIEGAENTMLEGATSMLEREPKPIWMVEICISEHQPENTTINPSLLSTFKIFWVKGYEAWTVNDKPRLVTPDEIKTIILSGKDTLLTHNFLFIENGLKTEILGA